MSRRLLAGGFGADRGREVGHGAASIPDPGNFVAELLAPDARGRLNAGAQLDWNRAFPRDQLIDKRATAREFLGQSRLPFGDFYSSFNRRHDNRVKRRLTTSQAPLGDDL